MIRTPNWMKMKKMMMISPEIGVSSTSQIRSVPHHSSFIIIC